MSVYELLNTLYVTLPDVYLHLDNDTVRLEWEDKTLLRVPLHHLQGIVVFGHVSVSSGLIHRCAEDGRALVWLGLSGQFKARLSGPVSGNVLLRRDQHRAAEDPKRTLQLARCFVAGKLQNSRATLLRSARDAEGENEQALRRAADILAEFLRRTQDAPDLDTLRGLEGQGAHVYFNEFERMVRVDDEGLRFNGRTRRPPRNPMNALLSFIYTLVIQDCISAVESVGLDPQIGFLHAVRPGRPGLALDLMEEFRSVLADRLVLTLVNRRQISSADFIEQPGGSYRMKDEARKRVILAYQEKKKEEITHSLLKQQVPWGILPHIQARLLARTIRREVETYLPFLYR